MPATIAMPVPTAIQVNGMAGALGATTGLGATTALEVTWSDLSNGVTASKHAVQLHRMTAATATPVGVPVVSDRRSVQFTGVSGMLH